TVRPSSRRARSAEGMASRCDAVANMEPTSATERCSTERSEPAAYGEGVEAACSVMGLVGELDQQDLLLAVDFVELDLDDLTAGGGDHPAGEGGLDGELAVSAVDEHEELDGSGTAVVEESVKGGADGAAGVEHIV